MEPAKAGNDEEEEMHPVPAKVCLILHTAVYALLKNTGFTFADAMKVCLSLRELCLGKLNNICTVCMPGPLTSLWGLHPVRADLDMNRLVRGFAQCCQPVLWFADASGQLTNIPCGQKTWQGRIWTGVSWQTSCSPPQLPRHQTSSGLLTTVILWC